VGLQDLVDDPLAVLRRADVALVHGGTGGVVGAELVRSLLAAGIPGGDGDAAGGEPLADRAADAADPTGDQGYLAGHVVPQWMCAPPLTS
jgi:hypothetical protein